MGRQQAESPAAAAAVPSQLLQLIITLVREAQPGAGAQRPVDWGSRLDRDLGLDSLARAELLARIDRAFGVTLPDDALYADTPRALLELVLAARPIAAAAEVQYPALAKTEGVPASAGSLLEVLDWHLQRHPERTHIYVYEGDTPEPLTFAGLETGAAAVAAGLRAQGLRPRETVALMLPTGQDYFFAFFGVLKAGGIPVPIYPPVRPSQLEEHLRRHGRILANAATRWLITVAAAKRVARLLRAEGVGLERIRTVEELRQAGSAPVAAAVKPEELAFLQYTSGSTGDPKGVMLTHANLLANIRALGARIGVTSNDVFVSWLPLYHDMGLIGAWFGCLYFAVPLAVMSPLAFLARPERWLWAIHRHRATISASPNFGYELCLRHLQPAQTEGLDLSSWRYAFNGAEPVSPDTLERFAQRFAANGLRRQALAPVYGLAESSVGLTMPPPDRGPLIEHVRRDVFMRAGRAEPAPAEDEAALRFVGCGSVLRGHEIRAVDSAGRELPDHHEGRLEFRGPSATQGYYRNPEASRQLFRDGWLDTGDRGYLANGEVFITGRVKDLIIRGGRNIHPYELEEAVGARPGVRKGCVAAFGSRDPVSGEEHLVVVAETRETDPASRQRLRRDIEATTMDLLAVAADDVRLVPPHSVLKTSSGKIRRAATRELYERGELGRPPRALWQQALRLQAGALRQRLRSWRQWLYASYAWAVFGVGALIVWLLVPLLPSLEPRWRLARVALQLLTRLTGLRIDAQGVEQIPATGACVLVSNHASYLDSLALTSVLPRPFRFVAKGEFRQRFFMRVLLERMDTLFVERFELAGSLEDAARITTALRAGSAVAFFPEGTLQRESGLHAFHMGAFVAAAETATPVVPVAIRGTRAILLEESWFPRRGRITILVGSPLRPQGSDWEAAVRLRDQARAAVLAMLGEPDLAGEE